MNYIPSHRCVGGNRKGLGRGKPQMALDSTALLVLLGDGTAMCC